MNEGLIPSRRRRCGLNRPTGSSDIWDMKDVFDSFWTNNFATPFFTWRDEMKTDVCETEKEYIIETELPGVRKEDIKVDLKDDVLTIAVENKEVVDEQGKNYIRKERRYGSQSRSYYMNNIKEDEVRAKFENGVLTLTLPKAHDIKDNKRRIDIE